MGADPAILHRQEMARRAETPIGPPVPVPEPEARPEEIAPGDLLPPRPGAIDRLIRFAYRRGVSARTLVRPFRKPARLRLLATASEPLPGHRPAGMALRAGHFRLAGRRVPIDSADYSGRELPPPLAGMLHRFEWLADLEAAGTRDKSAPVAEDILRRWLLVNYPVGEGPAWNPGDAGHRLMNGLVHAPLILSASDRGFRASVLRHMAATADWLERQVKKPLPAREALPAWAAITAAGLLLPDGKPRRLHGEAGLIGALGDAVGEDGGMLSRLPADQIAAMALLLRLIACYRACRREPPAQMEGMLSLLGPALLALTHADGSTGSWQGAVPVPAARVALLTRCESEEAGHQRARPRARPLGEAKGWGYQRLVAGQAVLQMDAAPPPSAREATAACASTLAIEFSHGDQRILVNCGGASLAGAAVPMEIREGLRSTAAHSTLELHDSDSTPVLDDGRLGQGVREVRLERGSGEAGQTLAATHDGYAARFGLLHERRLVLARDGLGLDGIDALVPRGRRAKKGPHPFSIRFHLGPGIEIDHALEGGGFTLAAPDGSRWRFRSRDVPVTAEESLWVDAGGIVRQTRQLVLAEHVDRDGGAVRWSLSQLR